MHSLWLQMVTVLTSSFSTQHQLSGTTSWPADSCFVDNGQGSSVAIFCPKAVDDYVWWMAKAEARLAAPP